MEQRTKFIIIGLAGLALAFVVLYMGAVNSKQSLARERDDLKKENAGLSGQLSKFQDNIRGYENKIASLDKQLEDISRDRDDLQRKYELANKVKEELIKKLQSQEEKPAPASVSQELPAGTDAYWAGILKQKTDLEIQLGNMRSELKSTQINNEQLQRDKGALELDINNLRHETEDLKRQLEYNKKLMDSLAQELVRDRNDKMQIQESFKEIRGENTTLMRQLKSLNNRKVNLDRKLQDFSEERLALQRRINELETMFKEKLIQANNLNNQLDAIRSGVKPEMPPKESVVLPPIVIKPSSDASGQDFSAGLEGKIMALNRENNFVIIDLGENQEVKVGDSFQVFHGENRVANITVIQTRQGISACDIKKETEPIEVGDTVR
ncbi:MAG: hypothetical protein AABY28_05090 [Candidatus Omnitrophota bacterium]